MKTKFIRQAWPLLILGGVMLMATGCPQNDYTVELQPAGPAMVRTVTFYRADGVNATTGLPNYKAFDEEELEAIAALYPTNGLVNHGDWHQVKGEFGNNLPGDVGGAGVYTNLVTSLGSAGFYVERFRGNEDLAGLTEARFKAADELTDLALGWSQAEMGQDPRYPQLRTFLDRDFRHDLKNLSSYCWEWQVVGDRETNAAGEFIARISQYLYDRGYFKIEELPKLSMIFTASDHREGYRWVQRLMARRMGVPDSEPVPASLAFLANEATAEQSFTNYFAHTDLYRQKLAEWETNAATNDIPPGPDKLVGDMIEQMVAIDFNLFGDAPDHLKVKLKLPSAPFYSNGEWDDTNGVEVWDSTLRARADTNHLPLLCYATWAGVNEAFQTNHFGRVAVAADDLAQYCLWRCNQDTHRGVEWDAFVAGLQPGSNLTAQIDEFRFTDETEAESTNHSVLSSVIPRELLKGALK